MEIINASPVRHTDKANRPGVRENGNLIHIISKTTKVQRAIGGPTLAEQYELSESMFVLYVKSLSQII